jgi:hypothetical protein
MKTENNHSNHIVSSGPIEMIQPGAKAMKTSLWTKVKNTIDNSLSYIAGSMFGIAVILVFILMALVGNISSRAGECEFVGKAVGVRSEYYKSTGCNLLIDGKYTPLSEVKLQVEK